MSQTPLPESRRERLLSLIHQRGAVRAAEAAEVLGVSPVTVRRDIAQLAQAGAVERIRGGARAASTGVRSDGLAGTSFGVLVPSLDYYWPSVVAGANAAADEMGVRLVLQGSAYRAGDNLEQLAGMASSGTVQGLILVPDLTSDRSSELIQRIVEESLPTIIVERTLPRFGPTERALDEVGSDHAAGAAMAARYLVGLGHRRLALLADADSPTTPALHDGWSLALAGLGLVAEEQIDQVSTLRGRGRDAMIDDFLGRCIEAGTTAILVHNDRAALVTIDRLAAAGTRVPHEMSVVTYDDELATLARPQLTAVAPSKADLGATAVRMLADRLQHPDRAPRRVAIRPSLVERASTAPPGQSAVAGPQPSAV